VMISSSIHFPTGNINSFFIIAETIRYVYHIFFIYSPVDDMSVASIV
jgi:hypothetical protein